MGDLVEFVNRDVAIPAVRARRWAAAGAAYVLAGDVVLVVQRVRTDDTDRLRFQFVQGAASADLPHYQLFRIGDLTVTPRAIRFSGTTGRPAAVLLEFGGNPAAFHHAIEAAA